MIFLKACGHLSLFVGGIRETHFGFFDGPLRNCNLGEGVHGSLDWVAFDTFDRVEQAGYQISLLFEAFENVILLLCSVATFDIRFRE